MQSYHYLQAYEGRGQLSSNDTDELRRIQLGLKGETLVRSIIEPLRPNDLCVLFDVWLDCFGTTQLDALILAPKQIYLINVKNYQFELKTGEEFSHKVTRSIHNQLLKSKDILQNILDDLGIEIPIETVVMFANDYQKDWIVELKPCQVVLFHEIAFWFRKLISRHGGWQSIRQMEELRDSILAYQCEPVKPRWLEGLSHDTICQQLELGLRCTHCRAVNQMIAETQRTITCRCGYKTSRHKVVLATIDEYLALRMTKRFTRRQVEDFVVDVSTNTLIRILNKHFKAINYTSARYYEKTGSYFE